ncbi:hypothetical protein GCM10007933_43190 [Zoogloea oryzae]|uniref:Uncharacterized protein n=1 Tax=Zoogloea oryzae TaxID=310767 RepID=A0ABQ6FL00_9RHOO|nr:hypothetical protein GCM10007933_43190 [Zoogloea oryzae]
MAPESMTHLEDEEMRHVFGLPDSAMAVTEDFEVLSDPWYSKNLSYSSAGTRTELSEEDAT